ncbi:MAG: hypothetical protein KKF46_04585 [Nanoarchaeota archaeon]|nr:hypothetical protein [Nanoarchaeota archaeon]MBU1321612.1 hypothetical protein [Nanoarchaeota archaeon]MBU1597993.1 hypothetical protein [Nanoarchaeota archaeon]MBU2440944.1 hypothetical protein [Nanoarchaeota archaeon]
MSESKLEFLKRPVGKVAATAGVFLMLTPYALGLKQTEQGKQVKQNQEILNMHKKRIKQEKKIFERQRADRFGIVMRNYFGKLMPDVKRIAELKTLDELSAEQEAELKTLTERVEALTKEYSPRMKRSAERFGYEMGQKGREMGKRMQMKMEGLEGRVEREMKPYMNKMRHQMRGMEPYAKRMRYQAQRHIHKGMEHMRGLRAYEMIKKHHGEEAAIKYKTMVTEAKEKTKEIRAKYSKDMEEFRKEMFELRKEMRENFREYFTTIKKK